MDHFINFDAPFKKLQCVSLSKTLVSALGQKWCFHPWDRRERASLVVIWCQESNGIDSSSIRFLTCILWRVETHFLEPFRDPTYNWFRVLKPKRISGLRIWKFEKVYLGTGKVIKLPISSHRPFYFFWPHIAKIAMCLTKQNPNFWYQPNMMILAMGHKGQGHP